MRRISTSQTARFQRIPERLPHPLQRRVHRQMQQVEASLAGGQMRLAEVRPALHRERRVDRPEAAERHVEGARGEAEQPAPERRLRVLQDLLQPAGLRRAVGKAAEDRVRAPVLDVEALAPCSTAPSV